jgi:hypothetical protein
VTSCTDGHAIADFRFASIPTGLEPVATLKGGTHLSILRSGNGTSFDAEVGWLLIKDTIVETVIGTLRPVPPRFLARSDLTV